MKLFPLILCGGSGTRLWPLSRTDKPKQFISLFSERSPLQYTIDRINDLQVSHTILIANENHRSIVEKEAHTLNSEYSIIFEPVARNTAPAITMAALFFREYNPTFFVVPADHHIQHTEHFSSHVLTAYEQAQKNTIVCFGIVPSVPETGYGYIHRGNELHNGLFEVNAFVEKPSYEKAQEYLATQEYYWNSGMFMMTAQTWLDAMEEYAQDILQACIVCAEQSIRKGNKIFIETNTFSKVPSDSIDYAIMEKTPHRAMLPFEVEWSDIGSFNALYALHEKDDDNNVCIGNVVAMETTNSYIHSTKKMITTLGVDNLLIIETPDALLVANRENAQDIKKLVEYLKQHRYEVVHKHHIVHRPWGQYETIHFADRFQVKCITVNPGESLSLQLHYHRAEHWIVVQGTGKIYNGDDVIVLHEDQSTYIPLGTIHRLENPGKIPLQIIEVQTGAYLGEDDIVRLEDKYERK
ncbi:MAG: mannose-1-phosphate guanylyltransferase/mannose-6-phosphate isomerase [Desulfovibrionaceae bacterium]|nr:mannose-1-phosphate guanylyltransferase/mannose-6-phosphate isomerase [Desulfovibrionaceae bacterium]